MAVFVPASTNAAVIAAYKAYGDVYIEKRVSGSRTQRLAKLRNQLFSLISGADHVIVNDFDAGVNTKPYNLASFKRAFELIGTWNGISFVVEPYWDLWALRECDVIPYDHWGRNRKKNKIRTPRDANRWLSRQSNEVVPVISAFMMLSIYDPSVLRQRYDEKTLDCEFGKIGILRASLRV